MTSNEPIAEKVIYAVDKDGRGFDMGLQIGRPYRIDSLYEDWACPVAMIGLHGRFPDMMGVDSWQALALALDLVNKLLAFFVEDGGKLYDHEGGTELSVDEAFGVPYTQPDEILDGDFDLTPEQQERISRLTPKEIAVIDEAILRNCSLQFQKIARVVGNSIVDTEQSIPAVADIFYADRVRQLIAEDKLQFHGNILSMRLGEVKLQSPIEPPLL